MKPPGRHIPKPAAIAGVLLLTSGLACLAQASDSPSAKADAAALRHTRSGDVVGFATRDGGFGWMGIAYARPPVGELRWRAPRPVEPWTQTRKALQAGSPCPQALEGPIVALHGKALSAAEFAQRVQHVGSEDCLYLNIRSPQRPDSDPKLLPVMVWLHGGANLSGRGDHFDMTALVNRHKIVGVTLNYRLGPFGFFSHPALRAEAGSAEDRSGNYGILDQVEALRWLRENIAAFGGDPNNVTVFGVSAGGWNSLALLSSPKARGLFHRAIVQSGVDLTRTMNEAEDYIEIAKPGLPVSSAELLLQLLAADGRVGDRGAAKTAVSKMPATEIAGYLRSKSLADFDRAYAVISERKPSVAAAVPIRDGAVIPVGGFRAAFAQPDGHNRLPVIIGTTRDEDQPYALAEHNLATETQGPTGVEFRLKDARAFRLISEYMSRLWKSDFADALASALTDSQPGEAFVYRLDWDDVEPWPGPDREPRGAGHGQDIAFVFGAAANTSSYSRWSGTIRADSVAQYQELSSAIMSYWAEFAYSGKPGRGRNGELPEWKPWSAAERGDKFIVLDSTDDGGLRMSSARFTKADIINQLAVDARLPTLRDKCGLLGKLVRYGSSGRRVVVADYNLFQGGACAREQPITDIE